MAPNKSDLLQGTLDLLILQIVALGPVHGYAVAQRLQQISGEVAGNRGRSIRPSIAWKSAAGSRRNGGIRRPDGTRSSTVSPRQARNNSGASERTGSGWQRPSRSS
jgi:hypothetical protein